MVYILTSESQNTTHGVVFFLTQKFGRKWCFGFSNILTLYSVKKKKKVSSCNFFSQIYILFECLINPTMKKSFMKESLAKFLPLCDIGKISRYTWVKCVDLLLKIQNWTHFCQCSYSGRYFLLDIWYFVKNSNIWWKWMIKFQLLKWQIHDSYCKKKSIYESFF